MEIPSPISEARVKRDQGGFLPGDPFQDSAVEVGVNPSPPHSICFSPEVGLAAACILESNLFARNSEGAGNARVEVGCDDLGSDESAKESGDGTKEGAVAPNREVP